MSKIGRARFLIERRPPLDKIAIIGSLTIGPETVCYVNLRLQLPPSVSPAHNPGDRAMDNIPISG
jgi:hypothetical protein